MGFAIPSNTGTGKWIGNIFGYLCNIQVNNLLIKPIQAGVAASDSRVGYSIAVTLTGRYDQIAGCYFVSDCLFHTAPFLIYCICLLKAAIYNFAFQG